MYFTQTLKRALQVNPDGIATIFGNRQQTYRQFADQVAKLAGGLIDSGLTERGRLAIISLNSDRFLEYYYAVPWCGAIITPLNTRLSTQELIYMLNDSESEILVIDDNFVKFLPIFKDNVPSLKNIIFIGEGNPPNRVLIHDKLIEKSNAIRDTETGGEELVGIFYTGGTTGLPKGVMVTHDNLVVNMLNTVGILNEEDDIYMHVAPMFHLADHLKTASITVCGSTHVFVPKFDPIDTMKCIEKYKVTDSVLIPVMINILANHPQVNEYDLSSMKSVLYGASPMPLAVLKNALTIFPECKFAQAYGLTETGPLLTILSSKYHVLGDEFMEKMKSAGQSVYGTEIKIVDENDIELDIGEIGEIIARGANIMKGYWKNPDATKMALRGGWFHTGDAGFIDSEGFLYITDRIKDMIVSGGENVYSIEVENALYQHPAVAFCTVIGIPSEKWGEAVHAIINLKPGRKITKNEIIAHCKQLIAGYKCPQSVIFSDKVLPLSGTNKIMKNELRKPYWKGKTRKVN